MRFTGFILFSSLIMIGCNSSSDHLNMLNAPSLENHSNTGTAPTQSEDLTSYWYSGKAEITSYRLTQARYGEQHEGTATLVFVTEPFSPTSNTKADFPTEHSIPVLKLNHTRKFTTGVYPYSLMTSSFFPVEGANHSLKISSSSQEWCGHSYFELKNTSSNFITSMNSYFEGESYSKRKLTTELLEDDLWSMIRYKNNELPNGTLAMYPSAMFCGLTHTEFKPYTCTVQTIVGKQTSKLKINYPEINRSVSIEYNLFFPYDIISWKEVYDSGFGPNRKQVETTATKINTIRSDYWNKNTVADSTLRKKLGL